MIAGSWNQNDVEQSQEFLRRIFVIIEDNRKRIFFVSEAARRSANR